MGRGFPAELGKYRGLTGLRGSAIPSEPEATSRKRAAKRHFIFILTFNGNNKCTLFIAAQITGFIFIDKLIISLHNNKMLNIAIDFSITEYSFISEHKLFPVQLTWLHLV